MPGAEFQVDSLDTGWSSGRSALTDGAKIEVPLAKAGENASRSSCSTRPAGPLALERDRFVITRTAAQRRRHPRLALRRHRGAGEDRRRRGARLYRARGRAAAEEGQADVQGRRVAARRERRARCKLQAVGRRHRRAHHRQPLHRHVRDHAAATSIGRHRRRRRSDLRIRGARLGQRNPRGTVPSIGGSFRRRATSIPAGRTDAT